MKMRGRSGGKHDSFALRRKDRFVVIVKGGGELSSLGLGAKIHAEKFGDGEFAVQRQLAEKGDACDIGGVIVGGIMLEPIANRMQAAIGAAVEQSRLV